MFKLLILIIPFLVIGCKINVGSLKNSRSFTSKSNENKNLFLQAKKDTGIMRGSTTSLKKIVLFQQKLSMDGFWILNRGTIYMLL